MVAGSGIAERWGALAVEDEATRGTRMQALLAEVLSLGDAERDHAIEEMVEAEYRLPDDRLKPFTASRLRAWLAIAAENMDGAKALAHGYDVAFDRRPAGDAMRRSTIVQAVARNELSTDEVQGLFDLIPSLVRQVPRVTPPSRHREPLEAKKPFWKFW